MLDNALRVKLLDSLSLVLRDNQFVLKKRAGSFFRYFNDGWHEFQVLFLERESFWEVQAALMIRKNVVENIYHKVSFFEQKYQKFTPTVGISVEDLIYNYSGQEHRFALSCEADIHDCSEWLLNIFNNVALPFFSKYDSLIELDKAVNVIDGKSIFRGLKYEGNTGLILAKLVHNSNYQELVDKYKIYYERLSSGFYLPEYEGVVRVLNELP